MKKGLFILLLLAGTAHASPVSDLKLVGAAEMNWMFWKIYDIQLLNSDGRFDREKYPLALVIRYARDIDAAQLVSSTVDEWQRQEIEFETSWQNTLSRIWPDVRQGDEIILRVDRDLNSHFFFNKAAIGSVEDPDFAPAFLAIWLSENTLKPDLTRRLTGTF